MSKIKEINKLDDQHIAALSDVIGSSIRQICDEAVHKANAVLNVYGMKARMEIEISGLDDGSDADNL